MESKKVENSKIPLCLVGLHTKINIERVLVKDKLSKAYLSQIDTGYNYYFFVGMDWVFHTSICSVHQKNTYRQKSRLYQI